MASNKQRKSIMDKPKESKTNHKTGWHKKTVNPTTNYPRDGHEYFCKRCQKYNDGCPITGTKRPTKECGL